MKTICRNCGKHADLFTLYRDKKILKCHKCNGYQWIGCISNLSDLYAEDYFNGQEYVDYQQSASIYRLNLERKWQNVLKAPCLHKKSERELSSERILEIGSATGEFLKVLKSNNFSNLLGAEISGFCRSQASSAGFQMLNPLSIDYMKSIQDFDPTILCAWDVWEHLENPCAVFQEILSCNTNIEVVALSTVDSGSLVPLIQRKRWRQYHPPTHLNYPTKKSFRIFFEEQGFSVISTKSFGYYRPLSDYLSVFLGKKMASAFTILFKIPFYLNLYDIQLVVAQKK